MRVRLAAYGIITRERDGVEEILLAHWNERGRSGWTLPGGGVDPGEDPIDGVIREIWEETGYHAGIDELLGIHSRVIPVRDRAQRSRSPMQAIRIVYRASIKGGELRNEVGGSTDEAAWHPLDSVAGLRTVSLVNVGLRMLRERPRNGHLSGA